MGSFQVHFFSIGTGDATLIVSPTGETLLVDLGVPQVILNRRSASAETVVERIAEIVGEPRVDAALITHFHTDHLGTFDGGEATGGLPYAVDTLGLEVGRFLDRGATPISDSDTQNLYLSWLVGRAHEEVHEDTPQAIDLGPEVDAEILGSPGGDSLWGEQGDIEENNYSLPLRITYGDLEISLCGDLPGSYTERGGFLEYQDVETQVAGIMGTVEILKPNHHGSQSSTNMAWIQALNPQVAVYTLGPSDVGYPHEYTWDRLVEVTHSRGGRVYLTTDEGGREVDGEVVVTSDDGHTFTVNGESHQALSDEEEADLASPLSSWSDEADNSTCSDGRDNDGDCYCDCDDWSCALAPLVTVCDGGGSSYCGYEEGDWCDGQLASR